jgi:hypothetical protein
VQSRPYHIQAVSSAAADGGLICIYLARSGLIYTSNDVWHEHDLGMPLFLYSCL